ncbi:mitochondrial import receptor subunit OR translocase-domain-containing protein [Apiosordaria backusii]|uniref:Mitochondrial import receptor subunit OR translocase-domain-containing protein n=1 Tax=Apiosordaria backusii TaxID=314023 RepID=A0AA40A0V7_9PEZI|nr:mitochondrial import receptor subunit OR translocase-domain-containing protein [Apiosordaria backusii]
MFGLPPQISEAELRAAEAEATFTIQRVVATAAALYLCMPSTVASTAPKSPLIVFYSRVAPFVIDAVSKMF